MNGERLKQERLYRGLTQENLGHAIGIRNVTISQYESGARTPSSTILSKLASVLGVSTDYLLDLTERRHDIILPVDRVAENPAQYDAAPNASTIAKDIIEDFNSLSPEERNAVEIMIRTLAAAKKEGSAVGE